MLSFFFFLLNYEISPLSYVDLESTDIDLEKECKFLGTKSKKKKKMSFFLVLLKKLKEDKLRNSIEEFKTELKGLKNILN